MLDGGDIQLFLLYQFVYEAVVPQCAHDDDVFPFDGLVSDRDMPVFARHPS